MKNNLLITVLFFTGFIFAQTGPGGIGTTDGTSNLVLWLNAEEAISNTSWNDKSGYGFDFTNGSGATLNIATINGYNSFSFNGTSNYFEKSYESVLNPDDYTVFSVDKVISNNTHKAVFSNRDDVSGQKGFILYSVPNSNKWSFWTGGGGWNTTNSDVSTANIWASQTITYRSTNHKKIIYIQNTEKATTTHTMVKNMSKPFRVGAGKNESAIPNYYFKGDIGEVIMYNSVLSDSERIIVDNYLSAKYNYTLTSNDLYTQDNSANGNFDHHVAGIGQADDGSNHTDSQGTGIVRINTPSALSNNDYLFWGEETKDPIYTITTTTDYLERLDRKWRVSKANNLGTVSVSVSTDDLVLSGMQSCASVKLVVSSDSNFTTKTTYNMTLSGGVHTATAVNFNDGDYFTFEYIDQIVLDDTQFYNGSGYQNRPNPTDACYKFLVKNTADGSLALLTQGATVREIEVEQGGVLAVGVGSTGIKLEVVNNIQLDGDIRLISNSQLIQTHAGTSQVTGDGKLYIDKQSNLTNVYQSGFWSSPVTTSGNTFTISDAMKDGTIPTSATSTPQNITFTSGYDGNNTTSPITISSFWLAKLTDALDWNRHRSETTSHDITEGFNMKSLGANFTFVGKPNDGDYTSNITSGNSSLLGNPYPSAMDADVFILNNQSIFTTLYFWDGIVDNSNSHVRSAYEGGFATRVIGLGTAFNGGYVPTRYISPGQAFFVDASSTGSILFKNSHRVFNLAAPFYGRTAPVAVMRLGLDFEIDNNETFHRQLAIGFRGATSNYESVYDAIMYDIHPTDFTLQVANHTSDFVITGIENYSEDLEIPLHVVLDQPREMVFSIDGLENFSPNYIYLKDAETNQYYNLQNNVRLNLPTGNYTNRFSVVFTNSVATISDVLKQNKVSIIDFINSIELKSNLVIKKVIIYNTLGQKIIAINKNNKQVNIPIQTAKPQVLFIKTILENGQEITTKLIKK